MASTYDDPLERLKQRKLQPAPTGVTANPAAGKVNAAGGLANIGRSVQQSAANYAGIANGPSKAAVKQGIPMPGRPQPTPVAQPMQVQNRMFRGQQPVRPMVAQMSAAPPTYTSTGIAPAGGGGIKNAMGGNSFGLNDSIGSMRDVTQIGNQRVMNIPGYQSSSPVAGMSVLGGAVPQGQGGAGQVQTRIDSRTPREWIDLVAEQGRTILGNAPDNTGYGGGAGSVGDQIKHNTDTAAQAYRDGSWVGNIVGTGRPMDQDGIMDSIGRGGTGGGGGGDGPDWSDPKSVIEWLTSMGLGAASGAIGPSADFADQLNDATKPSLLDYFDNFQDLSGVKATGDRFMDPEFYKKYDDLQREQLRSDVDRNRDALMRNALSRQAGGGRGMGGDFAGQVMDASNKAITEGNRGIAMDSLQRQLAGSQAGAQMKTQAQGMIYDLMNQGRTDPREILSFIAETAPEILGSAMELIGAMKPF
jgi:hypothetical protein